MKPDQVKQQINKRLDFIIHEDLPILKKIKKFVITSGGKRIRPILHYYFYVILGGNDKEWADVGAIGELIHAASLLHDDVVDDAFERRGSPSINSLHGNKTAILSGDYLLGCGIDHLQTLKHSAELLPVFTRVIRLLAIGELLQMEWEQNFDIEEKTYQRIILGKTASLFGAMTEGAAILSKKEKSVCLQCREFGETMGNVFQLRDDYLDYFGKNEGKDPYQDFERGLITAPVIKLRGRVRSTVRKELKEIWTSRQKMNMQSFTGHEINSKKNKGNPLNKSNGSKHEKDKVYVINLMESSGAKELLRNDIEEGLHSCMNFLRKFPETKERDAVIDQLRKLMV